jgi:hypothetical protein
MSIRRLAALFALVLVPIVSGAPGVPGGGGVAVAAGETGLVPLQPARLLDTRATGVTVDGSARGGGLTDPAAPLVLQVEGRGGVPASGAGAVVVNVTVDNSTAGTGFVTIYPTGASRPTASALNYTPGAVVANEVVAKLGTGGTITLFTASSTHLIVDVVGWFPTAASSVFALTPQRYLDTRPGEPTFDGAGSGGGLTGRAPIDLTVAGRGAVPADAAAVVVNVTVVNTTANSGFVTVFPTGSERPLASSANFAPGQVVANELVAKVGTGGRISLFTNASTHLAVDVVGYFLDAGAAGAHSLVPARLLDTRADGVTVDGTMKAVGRRAAASSTCLSVLGRGGVPASGVGAVIVNVTVPNSGTGQGFVTVFPDGSSQPTASSLNVGPGGVVANELIAKVGSNGAIRLYTQLATDVVVDVVGWFPTAAGVSSPPAAPCAALPAVSSVPAAAQHVQAIYAVPADRSPVAGREAAVAHTVSVMQTWYDGQTGGRHPSFTRTSGGAVSVITVQLTSTYAQLAASTSPEPLIDAQVRAKVGSSIDGMALAVVLEGATSGSYCGRTGTQLLIPIENCDITPSATSVWPYDMTYLMGHEIAHLLGAVASCAPHASGGHVNDDPRDVLYNGSAARDWDHLMLDPGHDDYYAHSNGTCADIEDSPYLGGD